MPFQFLIGSLEARQTKIITRQNMLVSIPHRQSGSQTCQTIVIRPCVSIPHRQSGSYHFDILEFSQLSFNSSQVVWKRRRVIGGLVLVSLFQFLIGSLEAEIVAVPECTCSCFNSSQVVWKRDSCSTYRQRNQFQFLIGSLEAQRLLITLQREEVSIPHMQSGGCCI